MKIRIATYNIHKGVSPLGNRPRIHALKQAISMLDANVFFLQEVQGRHDLLATRYSALWPQQPQHDFLAGDDLHCAYGMNAVYDHGHHGNALLSSYPILSSSNEDVSDHAYESRGILHCILQTPVTDVHCYVIHLGLFARSRRRQSQALIKAVQASAPPDAPIIIAGDFNDWTNSLSDTLRTHLGVREVFDERAEPFRVASLLQQMGLKRKVERPARTFPAAMPWLRLDRIYVRGCHVESAQVMRGPAWRKLSDHAPIVATLRL